MNRNYLAEATALKSKKNHSEALKFFQKAYQNNPGEFTKSDFNNYAWTIYRVKIRKSKDLDELCADAELITSIIPQRDLTRTAQKCPYTLSVFKILSLLAKKREHQAMIHWIEKINPDYLDILPYARNDTQRKSKREAFLDWATNAYLKTYNYEKCVIMAKKALRSFDEFTGNGEAWFKYRLAKSLYELGRTGEAIKYYRDAVEVLHNWYIYNDIANIYLDSNAPWIAQEYLCPAVLSSESNSYKAFIYYTCYNAFKSTNPKIALKHAELFYALRMEDNASVPYEIEKLDLKLDQINRKVLEEEITTLWQKYKEYLDTREV